MVDKIESIPSHNGLYSVSCQFARVEQNTKQFANLLARNYFTTLYSPLLYYFKNIKIKLYCIKIQDILNITKEDLF